MEINIQKIDHYIKIMQVLVIIGMELVFIPRNLSHLGQRMQRLIYGKHQHHIQLMASVIDG